MDLKLRHWVDIEPAVDRGYVRMRFLVAGPFLPDGREGAIQFLINTGWLTDRLLDEVENRPGRDLWVYKPNQIDLGYHSPIPMYKEHEPLLQTCDVLAGQPCYYDGSGLNGEKPWKILREEGDQALWEFLDNYWHYVFRSDQGDFW